jgi:3-oxoacyl-[acyl-carrier protein] reductase
MEIRLDQKVAIITGSIQGIGKETAKMLAENGAAVVINNNKNPEELQKVADEIISTGGKAKAVVADVTKKVEAQKLIDAALELGDSIDILVNNAGGLVKRVSVSEFDEDHFATVMDINLKSSFLMSHLVASKMKQQKSGKIINLSSQAAHDGGGPGAAAYAAAKGATWTFTKSLAKELAPSGITVNCVSPGLILNTAFHDTFTPKEAQKNAIGNIPLGRGGSVKDIVNVILFLASELSDYMTGQTVEVNGGLYMP